MRNPGGYAVLSSPDGMKETDTFTCGHCQHLSHVKPLVDAADIGGLCKICNRLICGPCTDKGICAPWEEQFKRMETRERFLKAVGI